MVMLSSNFPDLTGGLVLKTFKGIYEGTELEWKKVFKEQTGMRNALHRETMMYGFDVAREKLPGSATISDDGGTELTYEHLYVTYALQSALTQELIEDGDLPSMTKTYSEHITRSLLEAQEIKCADYLNRAFDGAFPIGDGQALCSANHPQFAGVQSNLLTAATLAQTSLEAATAQVWGARDFRGKIIGLKSDTLVCSKDNYLNGVVLMENTLRAGTTNNDVSPLRYVSDFKNGVVKMTRLTSSALVSPWFIVTNAPHGLSFFWHPDGKPRLANDGSFEADTMKIKGRERFAVGATNYRGVFGNAGV